MDKSYQVLDCFILDSFFLHFNLTNIALFTGEQMIFCNVSYIKYKYILIKYI